jgi:Chaperone of endosialidase
MTTRRLTTSIDWSPSRLALFFIALMFACCAIQEQAHAVLPPPDGGYAGGNTAEGHNALLSLTTGGFNTAVGFLSLRANATNQFNTGVGAGALLFNASDENTATGAFALLSNTTGALNTANGTSTLLTNTIGYANTAIGGHALLSNAFGFGNSALGASALTANTSGNNNTAIGKEALLGNTIGNDNTATGFGTLSSNIEGNANTAIGIYALASSTGNYNTALGEGAGVGVTTADNVICLGTPGVNVSNSCYIGNITGQTVGLGGSACYVDNDGKMGIVLSARRFKTDIADMDNASEALLALRPVTFHYKRELDKTGIPQFGLIAEEVEAVSSDLVVRDKQGEISTVRYEAVNAMLLNEFLKEHRKVEALEANVAQQQKQIAGLITGLQEVSANIEVSKPAPQVVNDL